MRLLSCGKPKCGSRFRQRRCFSFSTVTAQSFRLQTTRHDLSSRERLRILDALVADRPWCSAILSRTACAVVTFRRGVAFRVAHDGVAVRHGGRGRVSHDRARGCASGFGAEVGVNAGTVASDGNASSSPATNATAARSTTCTRGITTCTREGFYRWIPRGTARMPGERKRGTVTRTS